MFIRIFFYTVRVRLSLKIYNLIYFAIYLHFASAILFRVGKDLQILILPEYHESISISKEEATSFQRGEFKTFPVDTMKIRTAFRCTGILPRGL
jgi:hypothetical protein